jgi:hypothetical protein
MRERDDAIWLESQLDMVRKLLNSQLLCDLSRPIALAYAKDLCARLESASIPISVVG